MWSYPVNLVVFLKVDAELFSFSLLGYLWMWGFPAGVGKSSTEAGQIVTETVTHYIKGHFECNGKCDLLQDVLIAYLQSDSSSNE